MRAVRILLALGAIAVGILAVDRAIATDACEDARRVAFGIGLGRALPDGRAPAAAAADAILRDCRGVVSPAAGAHALLRAGAVADAERLAREAVRRGPQDAGAWLALERVARVRGDATTVRRARARERALNPLRPAPRAPSP